jgi:L-arabinokinase
VRHWVGSASYSDVRTAAFMGYCLIALKAGAKPKDLALAKKTGDVSKLPFGGYLARIIPESFQSQLKGFLPEKMKGRDFSRQCASIDTATRVKPGVSYPVLAATRHPIYENFRVGLFKRLLESLGVSKGAAKRRETLRQMGELMFQSHASYGACGLGEPVTDAIVEAARKAGPDSGIFGAKITGGGSGGTVCLLVEGRKGLRTVRRIAARTVKGKKPFLSLGSSDGCLWS